MKNAKLLVFLALLTVAAYELSCNPSITVFNRTNVGVRVAVFPPGGGRRVLSPSPGSSSETEVTQGGTFTAVAIPDRRYLEWAKDTRQTLTNILANPQGMTPSQVQNFVQQLKDIEAKIKQFESAAGQGDGCSGTISVETWSQEPIFGMFLRMPKSGTVDITADAAGKLQLRCSGGK